MPVAPEARSCNGEVILAERRNRYLDYPALRSK